MTFSPESASSGAELVFLPLGGSGEIGMNLNCYGYGPPDRRKWLIVDCGDAPGHALACLRAGVKLISMRAPNEKVADIARQMGAELVRRP